MIYHPHKDDLQVTDEARRRSSNHELILLAAEGRLKLHVGLGYASDGKLLEVCIDARPGKGHELGLGLNAWGRTLTKALQAGCSWDDLEPPAESGVTSGTADIGGQRASVGSVREAIWLLVREEIAH